MDFETHCPLPAQREISLTIIHSNSHTDLYELRSRGCENSEFHTFAKLHFSGSLIHV